MQLKDMRNGQALYMLDRKDVSVKVGKVVNVTAPHFDNRVAGIGKMVVDVTAEVDGKQSTYVMADNCECGYVGDVVLTPNRECVLREVEAVKAASEQALSMIDYHREAVAKATELLKEYSPEYRERTEATARMDAMEGKIDKLTDAVTALLSQKGGLA